MIVALLLSAIHILTLAPGLGGIIIRGRALRSFSPRPSWSWSVLGLKTLKENVGLPPTKSECLRFPQRAVVRIS
jgi:hypothetical protein